jgi:hypothetical protein
MIVSVHRNLNWSKGQGFSILGPDMRVIDRKLYVHLSECKFVVHRSGQSKAMATGIRNVHAFVRGALVHATDLDSAVDIPADAVEVSYNPFDDKGFYTTDDGKEIWGAPDVWFSQGKAYVR